MRTERQWDYEESVPAQEAYEEEEMCVEEDFTELEGYRGEYSEELGNYGSDLSGYVEEGYSQEKIGRASCRERV